MLCPQAFKPFLRKCFGVILVGALSATLVGALGSVLGCALFSHSSQPKRLPTAITPPKPITPNFENLISLIQEEKVTTIDQTLALLTTRYPDWLSHYTLGYRSHSLQKASYQNPRAIVFGSDGQFIMTFNGDRKLQGFGALETIAFDPLTAKYTFREILFKSENSKKDLSEAQNLETYLPVGDQILVSPANPTKCMNCHGYVNLHPIWERYFNWPGFYGSNDDNLFRPDQLPISRRISTGSAKSNEEKNWLKFKKLKGNRYRHLPEMNADLDDRPNLRLTRILHRQAMEAIGRELTLFPRAKKLAFSLNTILVCQKAVGFSKVLRALNEFKSIREEDLEAKVDRMNDLISEAEFENISEMRELEPTLRLWDPSDRYAPQYFLDRHAKDQELARFAWTSAAASDTALVETILNSQGKSLSEHALPFRRHFAFDNGTKYMAELTFALRPFLREELKSYPSQQALDLEYESANTLFATRAECNGMLQQANELSGADYSK